MTFQTTAPTVQQKTGYRYVKYTFFKVDPAWRKLSLQGRESSKKQFLSTLNETGGGIKPRSYSLVGTRGDVESLRIFRETFREGACRLEIPLRLPLHQKARVVQCAFRGETENNEGPRSGRPKIPLSQNPHVILFRNRRLRIHTLIRNRPSRRLPQPSHGSQNHRGEQVHCP